jgi:hypothetical protein
LTFCFSSLLHLYFCLGNGGKGSSQPGHTERSWKFQLLCSRSLSVCKAQLSAICNFSINYNKNNKYKFLFLLKLDIVVKAKFSTRRYVRSSSLPLKGITVKALQFQCFLLIIDYYSQCEVLIRCIDLVIIGKLCC